MRLLAIDTSSSATVVVAADGDRRAERRHDPAPGDRPAHTTAGLVLAAEALADLGLTWTDLQRVGVGVGPGSFTGLRAGLSAAAGLARRLAVPLVPLTTAALLEHAARAAHPAAGAVLAVVDGRRRELFVRHTPEPVRDPGDPAGITVVARGAVGELGSLAGVLVVGDGALLEREALTALGGELPGDAAPEHRVGAASLAALTAAGPGHPADAVRPAYGRRPDAVPTAEREATAARGAR